MIKKWFYFTIIIAISFYLSGCGAEAKSEINMQLPVVKVPGDFAYLSSAIDHAVEGQTVLVSGGSHNGDIWLKGKFITLIGESNPVINCEFDGNNGLNIYDANNTSINGFKFINCEDGISTDSIINLSNSIFVRNVDGIDFEGGGGIVESNRFSFNFDDGIDLDENVDVKIASNIISNNADDGIEIRLHPKVMIEKSNIIIEMNEIDNNGEDGIQLIDYEVETGRIIQIKRNSFNNNQLAHFSIMDEGNTIEDLSGGSISDIVFVYNNNFIGGNVAITADKRNLLFENNIIFSPMNYSSNKTFYFSTSNALWGAKEKYYMLDEIDPGFSVDYVITANSTLIDSGVSKLSLSGTNIVIPFNGANVDIGRHELK